MQTSLLKEIIKEIIPKDGEKIVEILYKKKNVNEFLISKKLNLTINQTRNILYRLANLGLVKFNKKKDKKKEGWYTYFWTLSIIKSLILLRKRTIKKINELELEIEKRKKERFYYSPSAEIEYTEEQALEYNFICPETGEVLELKDNLKIIDELDIKLSKLKIIIEETNNEIEMIQKKEEKAKERRLKKEAKKKEEIKKQKREERRKERESAKKKPSKKTKKKTIKKKPSKKTKKKTIKKKPSKKTKKK